MRNLLLALLVLCSLTSVVFPQQEKSPATGSGAPASKDYPIVYITFERFGKAINPLDTRMAETGEASKPKEKGEDIWLRLHNNSRWAIGFATDSMYLGKRVSLYRSPEGVGVLGLNDGMEVSIQYQIEEEDGRRVPYGSDMSFASWLPPGRSVLFSVRRDHLSTGRSIFITFTYEWGKGQVYSNNLAPVHRSQYWGYRLQEDAK